MKTTTRSAKERILRLKASQWLETAARWRVLSLLFQLPTRQSRSELNRLAGAVSGELATLVEEWTRVPLKEAEAEYHGLFGSGGLPVTESAYDPNALAGRGPLLADIAGFHEAFAYRPERSPAPVPDHMAAEADFLSYLAFKIAFALEAGNGDGAGIAVQAYERFLEEHLRAWLPRFQERAERLGLLFVDRLLPCLNEAAAEPGGCAVPMSSRRRS